LDKLAKYTPDIIKVAAKILGKLRVSLSITVAEMAAKKG
jgi:hypothetical protein